MLNKNDLVRYDWFGNMEYARVLRVYTDENGWELVLVDSGAMLPVDTVEKVEEL